MEELEEFKVKAFMSTDVVTVDEDTTVEDVIKMVINKKYNAFPVVRGEKLVGILSKIDLIKLYSLGLSPVYVNFWEHTAKKVKHIMRKAVVTVSPEDPVKYAADLIVEYRVRSLPVVEKDSKLVGILSIGDVLRAFMKIKEEFEKKGMGGEIQR